MSEQELSDVCNIALPYEIVEKLFGWHSGMDAVYALSSTGLNHPVSLKMIDAALTLLQRDYRHIKVSQPKLVEELGDLISDLETVLSSPENWTMQES